jgi:LysM repeat protein
MNNLFKTAHRCRLRGVGLLLLCCVVLIGPQPANAQANVIFTENFDGAFANDTNTYCQQGGCDVPQNWGVWFIPRRETDPQGVNFQPKYAAMGGARARSGNAQRIFETNKTFTGGIYRKVEGVQVGQKIRFTAWGQMWSTNDESPISARPSSGIRLKIGIDPLGGNNGTPSPLSGQVVWSAEQEAKDNFAQFTVETEARATTIIVYTYVAMKDIVRHNEAFWDDAVLEYAAAPATHTPTPDPASASSATAEGAATAAPAPTGSGGVNHTVVSGDTLYGLELQYGVAVAEIKRLNNLPNDNLSIGQVLIIKLPEAAPTPTATPLPTAPPAPAAGTAVVADVSQIITLTTPISGTGQLCVLAYFDDNGNGARDEEELDVTGTPKPSDVRSLENPVPNVRFTLTTGGNVVAEYVSDGVNEGVTGHCFENLPPIAYTVAATYTIDYVPTTPLNDSVNVNPGARSIFFIGLRRSTDGFTDVSRTPTPAPNPLLSTGNIFGILATIGGSLLVLGAVGIVVSLALRRRQI